MIVARAAAKTLEQWMTMRSLFGQHLTVRSGDQFSYGIVFRRRRSAMLNGGDARFREGDDVDAHA